MEPKNRILTLLVATIVLFSLQLSAKTSLRLNLTKGSVYEMTVSITSNMDQEMMGQQMKIETKMLMLLDYKVADVLTNKNYLIEYTVAQVKVDVSANGQQMSMDSQTGGNPSSEKLKAMVGQVIKMEVTPAGKVEKVEGIEAFISKLGDDKMMAQMVPMFSSDEGFKSFVGQTFSYIPENEVEQGAKWSSKAQLTAALNMDMQVDFELASTSGKDLNLNVTSTFSGAKPVEQMGMKMDMQIDGTQSGTMVVDSSDGWMKSQNLNQNIKMVMKMKNPQTGDDMSIPIEMKSVIESKSVKK
jgi:hypothetical protein